MRTSNAPLTEAVGKYLEGCIAAEEAIDFGPAFAELGQVMGGNFDVI